MIRRTRPTDKKTNLRLKLSKKDTKTTEERFVFYFRMVFTKRWDDQSKKMHTKLCKMHKLFCVFELTNIAEGKGCKGVQETKKQGHGGALVLWRYTFFGLVLTDQLNRQLHFICCVVLDEVLQLGDLIACELPKLYALSSRFR